MQSTKPSRPDVLVVGAGIGGIHASLGLADAGYRVALIDRTPAFGGLLPGLERQFPTDHCGMCRLLPTVRRDGVEEGCLKKGLIHRNIDISLATEVTGIEGAPGRLKVNLAATLGGVDPDKCTACGHCIEACPEIITDRRPQKAIDRPWPGQNAGRPVIDWSACTRCGACVRACPEDAIVLEPRTRTRTLDDLALVIMAGGPGLYDPGSTDLYGASKLDDVVTATHFERLFSLVGPFDGRPGRPSDGKPIQRLAWIQCVGSRNIMIGAPHCSSTCCIFSIKEAVWAKENLGPDTETSIFYMDMRTFGRDHQKYRDRAEKELGVRFVRARIHSLEAADQGGVLVRHMNEGGIPELENFDLVVMATGQKQGQTLPDWTGHEGVLVMENTLRLNDIAETVLESGRTGILAAGLLGKMGRIPEPGAAKENRAAGGGIAPVVRPGQDDSGFDRVQSVLQDSHFPTGRFETTRNIPVVHSVVVLGGGPTGLAAARALSESGLAVHLVEKAGRLGGNHQRIVNPQVRETVSELIKEVKADSGITIYLGARIVSLKGRTGSFKAVVEDDSGRSVELDAGAVLAATGGGLTPTSEYGLGQHERVVPAVDLIRRIDDREADEIVFIQCAGSREEPRNYCSRICCTTALTVAVNIKETRPSARITFFYRDVMTYGPAEDLYARARRAGIKFIPFDAWEKPAVTIEQDRPVVQGFDPVLREPVRIKADWVAPAQGLTPLTDPDLDRIIGLDRTPEGFLMEADIKWRPVETLKPGVYAAGLARQPVNALEAIREGQAAAFRIWQLLSAKVPISSGRVAYARPERCARCLTCLRVCPAGARYIDSANRCVNVDPLACQGCGACASECPGLAIEIDDLFQAV